MSQWSSKKNLDLRLCLYLSYFPRPSHEGVKPSSALIPCWFSSYEIWSIFNITMMSVPYIGNIRWQSMKGCIPWIINNYLLLSFTYYIWYLIINNYIVNYYSIRMSSRCFPNINTPSQWGRHSQPRLFTIGTPPWVDVSMMLTDMWKTSQASRVHIISCHDQGRIMFGPIYHKCTFMINASYLPWSAT